MKIVLSKRQIKISSSIIFWFIFSASYVFLKHQSSTALLASYIPLIGEVGLDLLIAVFACRLVCAIQNKNVKIIYLFMLVGFISAGLADGIYNVILNIYHFQYDNPLIETLFDAPFAVFLLMQLAVWSKILVVGRSIKSKESKWQYLPYALISILIFTLFMYAIEWKIGYSSILALFQAIDTLLEVAGFSLATICLARSQSTLVRYTSMGYLLIVSSDLIIRYQIISGSIPYLSSLEAIWMLGLLLFFIGLTSADNKSESALQLLPISSLQATIATWLLLLWLSSVGIFAATYYFFSSGIEASSAAKNCLSMLVPFSVLAIISSSFISSRISAPIARLRNIVSNGIDFDDGEVKSNLEDNKCLIDEFDTLERFIKDSFQISHEKNMMERELSTLASQVVHDIKSPLAVLRMMAQELMDIEDSQRQVVLISLNRINEIADGLLATRRNLIQSKNNVHEQNFDKGKIYELVSNVFMEKKIQYKDRSINITFSSDKNVENIICKLNVFDFKRVISNLINNAVEAISDIGNVFVSLKRDGDCVELAIVDTGCGMSEQVLKNINKGVSYNKQNGNGLGLKHALDCISQWGGEYRINSKENIGTTFCVRLSVVG